VVACGDELLGASPPTCAWLPYFMRSLLSPTVPAALETLRIQITRGTALWLPAFLPWPRDDRRTV